MPTRKNKVLTNSKPSNLQHIFNRLLYLLQLIVVNIIIKGVMLSNILKLLRLLNGGIDMFCLTATILTVLMNSWIGEGISTTTVMIRFCRR